MLQASNVSSTLRISKSMGASFESCCFLQNS